MFEMLKSLLQCSKDLKNTAFDASFKPLENLPIYVYQEKLSRGKSMSFIVVFQILMVLL
jgi:hypothetical protein